MVTARELVVTARDIVILSGYFTGPLKVKPTSGAYLV